MRVTFRSGAILLLMGVFLTGCSESGSSPSQGTSSPGKVGAVASTDKGTDPAASPTKADPDYVLGLSGMT